MLRQLSMSRNRDGNSENRRYPVSTDGHFSSPSMKLGETEVFLDSRQDDMGVGSINKRHG
jgi:hypothetical protein